MRATQGVPSTYRDWKKTMSDLYVLWDVAAVLSCNSLVSYVLWAWRLIEHGVMLEPDSRW